MDEGRILERELEQKRKSRLIIPQDKASEVKCKLSVQQADQEVLDIELEEVFEALMSSFGRPIETDEKCLTTPRL